MRRRLFVLAVLAAVSVALTGCSGSAAPAPVPTPSTEPLRTVDVCPATIVVPAESQQVEPSATQPPTVVLAVGGAVGFTIPTGARVGLLGAADAELDGQLCAAAVAPTDPAGSVTYVAQGAGDLAIGVQIGVEPVAQMFVRITG